MTNESARAASESVVCLGCRQLYDKPARGTAASRNPGCPRCGYVGWLSALVTRPERGDDYRPTA